MRVSIVERTPVAFVRQGNHIGLVDANGVLLDMPMDAKANEHYSFPVVTGISVTDPLSTRAARMKIYQRFTTDLDSSGEKISQELSDVDLSNPEDVKALIPDHSSEILVHFGEDDFLGRYRRFKEHLSEWRTVYPKLSSVDMRYERQVVLEMEQGAGIPVAPTANVTALDSKSPASVTAADAGDVSKSSNEPTGKPVPKQPSKDPVIAAKHAVVAKPVAKPPAHVTAQSEVAFDAPAKKADPKAKKKAVSVKHHPAPAKPKAKTVPHHPTQVVHP
jgi:cell division protein FtsQ